MSAEGAIKCADHVVCPAAPRSSVSIDSQPDSVCSSSRITHPDLLTGFCFLVRRHVINDADAVMVTMLDQSVYSAKVLLHFMRFAHALMLLRIRVLLWYWLHAMLRICRSNQLHGIDFGPRSSLAATQIRMWQFCSWWMCRQRNCGS